MQANSIHFYLNLYDDEPQRFNTRKPIYFLAIISNDHNRCQTQGKNGHGMYIAALAFILLHCILILF